VAWQVGALASVVAQAASFAATVPLLPGSTTPRIARTALTLVLIPVIWSVTPSPKAGDTLIGAVLGGSIAGSMCGLSASVVACAVSAAGDVIDLALGSPPFIERTPAGGPIARLYQLAYAVVLFQSGGLMMMIAAFAGQSSGFNHSLTLYGIAALAKASFRSGIMIAGPSLFAQALSTVIVGILSRVAPQIGGILFSAPLISGSVLIAITFGAVTLWSVLTDVVRQIVSFQRSLGL
jgi:flagellar biosynthesis protein FliR